MPTISCKQCKQELRRLAPSPRQRLLCSSDALVRRLACVRLRCLRCLRVLAVLGAFFWLGGFGWEGKRYTFYFFCIYFPIQLNGRAPLRAAQAKPLSALRVQNGCQGNDHEVQKRDWTQQGPVDSTKGKYMPTCDNLFKYL